MSRLIRGALTSALAAGAVAAGSPEKGVESLGPATAHAQSEPLWPKKTHTSYHEEYRSLDDPDDLTTTDQPASFEECKKVALESAVPFGSRIDEFIRRSKAGRFVKSLIYFGYTFEAKPVVVKNQDETVIAPCSGNRTIKIGASLGRLRFDSRRGKRVRSSRKIFSYVFNGNGSMDGKQSTRHRYNVSKLCRHNTKHPRSSVQFFIDQTISYTGSGGTKSNTTHRTRNVDCRGKKLVKKSS